MQEQYKKIIVGLTLGAMLLGPISVFALTSSEEGFLIENYNRVSDMKWGIVEIRADFDTYDDNEDVLKSDYDIIGAALLDLETRLTDVSLLIGVRRADMEEKKKLTSDEYKTLLHQENILLTDAIKKAARVQALFEEYIAYVKNKNKNQSFLLPNQDVSGLEAILQKVKNLLGAIEAKKAAKDKFEKETYGTVEPPQPPVGGGAGGGTLGGQPPKAPYAPTAPSTGLLMRFLNAVGLGSTPVAPATPPRASATNVRVQFSDLQVAGLSERAKMATQNVFYKTQVTPVTGFSYTSVLKPASGKFCLTAQSSAGAVTASGVFYAQKSFGKEIAVPASYQTTNTITGETCVSTSFLSGIDLTDSTGLFWRYRVGTNADSKDSSTNAGSVIAVPDWRSQLFAPDSGASNYDVLIPNGNYAITVTARTMDGRPVTINGTSYSSVSFSAKKTGGDSVTLSVVADKIMLFNQTIPAAAGKRAVGFDVERKYGKIVALSFFAATFGDVAPSTNAVPVVFSSPTGNTSAYLVDQPLRVLFAGPAQIDKLISFDLVANASELEKGFLNIGGVMVPISWLKEIFTDAGVDISAQGADGKKTVKNTPADKKEQVMHKVELLLDAVMKNSVPVLILQREARGFGDGTKAVVGLLVWVIKIFGGTDELSYLAAITAIDNNIVELTSRLTSVIGGNLLLDAGLTELFGWYDFGSQAKTILQLTKNVAALGLKAAKGGDAKAQSDLQKAQEALEAAQKEYGDKVDEFTEKAKKVLGDKNADEKSKAAAQRWMSKLETVSFFSGVYQDIIRDKNVKIMLAALMFQRGKISRGEFDSVVAAVEGLKGAIAFNEIKGGIDCKKFPAGSSLGGNASGLPVVGPITDAGKNLPQTTDAPFNDMLAKNLQDLASRTYNAIRDACAGALGASGRVSSVEF